MKPSRLLLAWLSALLALAVLLGTLRALQTPLPEPLDAVVWGLLLALLALAGLDAILTRRLPLPVLVRQLPASLALGRWSPVRLQLQHDYQRPLTLTVHDHAPDGLASEGLPHTVKLDPDQLAELTYRLRPTRRGLFQFERCEVAMPSPLGLWRWRRLLPLAEAVRVYPDFARLYTGQLLATDNWLSQLGVRQRQRRGMGQDFHQLREFREGDSLRQIDWKATARQRTPIAREYQDERDQQIIFLLDCGRRMRSQDDELAHFDHALDACLLLSHVALRQGDAVGLLTFAGEQTRYLAPRKGAHQLNLMLDSVYDLQSSQLPADFNEAASLVLARQKRRALVVLVTNLRDEDDEELLPALKRIGRQHRVLVASLREEVLDLVQHSAVRTWQESLVYCATIDYLAARQALHEKLEARGVNVLDARPGELGADLVTRYLSLKKAGVI